MRPAQAGDFGTEFMALILSARVVDSLDEALEHIARFGDHSDAIITTIEPGTCAVNGGRGTIVPFNGLLIVRNSPLVHQQIAGPIREPAGP
mgnify:CR=1 FL=1